MTINFKIGTRVLLLWGNPKDLTNVVTKKTPRGNSALYVVEPRAQKLNS